MDSEIRNQLLKTREELQNILRGRVKYETVGLCSNCDSGIPYDILKKALHGWKYGQLEYDCGCIGYVIKSPINGLSPEQAYNIAQRMGTMYIGEYGRRRLELAQRCIDVINQELAK